MYVITTIMGITRRECIEIETGVVAVKWEGWQRSLVFILGRKREKRKEKKQVSIDK